ncbi:MAG: hypothetical protein RR513_09365 [Muribaculaceae bacterium]
MKNITKTYLTHNNLFVKKSVDTLDTDIFMPYLIIDSCYLIYDEHIKSMDLKHKMKYHRTFWDKASQNFKKEFFKSFDEEQVDFIINRMDAFYDFIKNDLTILQLQVQNRLVSYRDEERCIFSIFITCNLLAQTAQYMWNSIYYKNNTYISIIERRSLMMMSELENEFRNKEIQMQSDPQPLIDSVRAFCNKIQKFTF